MARVLVPLPGIDFDPTEVSVPWRLLREAGHEVAFATEEGAVAHCDPLLLTGVVFGKLGADPPAKADYRALEADPSFRTPLRWRDLEVSGFDALLLPGGHAQGMKQLLESRELRHKLADFAALRRPIAAICHGVLPLARARDPATGRSLLHGRRTTCLPKYMEALAYALSFWKLGRYSRTYPAYVEDEVRAALASPADFVRGPITLGKRGSEHDDRGAFVCEDGDYLSARWPGDAYLLGRKLVARLAAR
jgi:putative intracellular protease/amidase